MVETANLTYAEPLIVPELAEVPLAGMQIASASPGFNVPTYFSGPQVMAGVEWIQNSSDHVLDALAKGLKQRQEEALNMRRDEILANRDNGRSAPEIQKEIAPAPQQAGASTALAASEARLSEIFAQQGIRYEDLAKGMGATAESLAGIEQAERNIATATSQAASQGLVGGTKEMEIKRELDALTVKKEAIIEQEKQLAGLFGAGAGGVNVFAGREPSASDGLEPAGKVAKPDEKSSEASQEHAGTGKVSYQVGPDIPHDRFEGTISAEQKQGKVTAHADVAIAAVAPTAMDEMLSKAGFDKNPQFSFSQGEQPTTAPSAGLGTGFAKVHSTSHGRGLA